MDGFCNLAVRDQMDSIITLLDHGITGQALAGPGRVCDLVGFPSEVITEIQVLEGTVLGDIARSEQGEEVRQGPNRPI